MQNNALNPLNLLKLLGSGVRPTEVAPVNPQAIAQADAAFSALLEKARSGELSSHKLVTIDEHANVKLTDPELARLSLAADQAEAQGLRTALVVFDDKHLILDVTTRTVTAKADLTPGDKGLGLVSGVDGVINLSSKLSLTPETILIEPPAGFASPNPSLTKLLSQLTNSSSPSARQAG